MENKNQIDTEENLKKNITKNITPLIKIINKELKQFSIEDVINMIFDLSAKRQKENNKNIDFGDNYLLSTEKQEKEFLSDSDDNTILRLKIFVQILLDKYGEDSLINELYNSLGFEDNEKNENDSEKVNKCDFSNLEENIDINKNLENEKTPKKIRSKSSIPSSKGKDENNSIKIDKITDHIISLKEESSRDIIGHLHKNKLGHIYLFYPSYEYKNTFKIEMKKIVDNKNKILFLCEMNDCSAYGVFDILSNNFTLRAKHSLCYTDHKHCQIEKKKKNQEKSDNFVLVIKTFAKLKSYDALIFIGNSLCELSN